jgi:hypothetical protein
MLMKNMQPAVCLGVVVLVVVVAVWLGGRLGAPLLGAMGCPNVSGNVLPVCGLERRRPEAGRTYCKRGVCAPGLEAVPDSKTAYTVCVPRGKTVEEACP